MPRDSSFFDELAQWLELERAEHKARARAEREGLTAKALEALGVAVPEVRVTEESLGLGGRVLATLERPQRAPWVTPFQSGDQVELTPRRSADEVAPVRAVVNRATRTQLQVAFDRPPPEAISDEPLRLDRVPNDVTFDRARAALMRWKGMDRGLELQRREVILGGRPPRSGPPPPFDPAQALNPEQLHAVRGALAAEDFFLIHGPPGTGKSTVLAEVAVQSARLGKRLLGTAASNAAVDHLLELCLEQGLRAVRVGHPSRVTPRLQEHTLDLLVERHPDRVLSRKLFDEAFGLLGYARKQRDRGRSRERFSKARASAADAKALMTEARALERKAVRSILEGAQVVCATLATLDGSVLSREAFDLALLDEATQATEPLSLIAFLRADRVVLAGDHQQLPPTVLSPEAARRGLSRSLFERLLQDHGDGVKRMLLEQYRMHEQIMRFPSREMYQDALRAHPSVASRTLGDLLPATEAAETPPFIFLDTAGKGYDEGQDVDSGSYRNPGEAEAVERWARRLVAAGLAPERVAVITPYSAQAGAIRDRLVDLPEVEVDTVDAYQGRERDAVLLSLTRSNGEGAVGFLADTRRMNVALTRAKRHLFVVGDSATLASHPFYARFVDYAHGVGGYRSAWEVTWLEGGAAGID